MDRHLSSPSPSSPSIDIYLVRHAESCSNLLDDSSTDPLLSTTGILQCFMLRDYLHSNPIKYDKVLSSSLMRTIITAMISLCSMGTPNTNVIHVIPFVKTIKNETGRIQVNTVSNLKKKINRFKKLFYKSNRRIHFPRIDYQLLQKYENDASHHELSSKEQFDEYISHVSSSSSLLVFTHKTFIMEMTHTDKAPKNTSVTLVSSYNDDDASIRKYYNPKPLRSSTRKHTVSLCRKRTQRKK
jgi:broad specificity phosphatase PhoE